MARATADPVDDAVLPVLHEALGSVARSKELSLLAGRVLFRGGGGGGGGGGEDARAAMLQLRDELDAVEARLRAGITEDEDLRARVAELDAAHDAAQALLAEARAEGAWLRRELDAAVEQLGVACDKLYLQVEHEEMLQSVQESTSRAGSTCGCPRAPGAPAAAQAAPCCCGHCCGHCPARAAAAGVGPRRASVGASRLPCLAPSANAVATVCGESAESARGPGWHVGACSRGAPIRATWLLYGRASPVCPVVASARLVSRYVTRCCCVSLLQRRCKTWWWTGRTNSRS